MIALAWSNWENCPVEKKETLNISRHFSYRYLGLSEKYVTKAVSMMTVHATAGM